MNSLMKSLELIEAAGGHGSGKCLESHHFGAGNNS
jgi:hypothetical protein